MERPNAMERPNVVKIYLDSTDIETMRRLVDDPLIEGFTTNPSLLRKAGVTKYQHFAHRILEIVKTKPVSFEVLSDDWAEMEKQAYEISTWGNNVWVKIPITNTHGESSIPLIKRLQDLQLNITAVMTHQQLEDLVNVAQAHHVISIFAGRINDADREAPIISAWGLRANTLWASTRHTFSIKQAELYGYDIITMTPDLIAKLPLRGKDLAEYSLETVKQFHEDGKGITF